MYQFIKSCLFLMKPERAHYVTMNLISFGLKIPGISAWIRSMGNSKKAQPVTVFGITFPNRVGLAAGFDKNARYMKEFKALGFGHIEIGTVTPKPQPGNDKPRLFRLVKDEAVINRMGFNNDGVDAVVERLKNRPAGLIVGGNIGKNKVTPNEEATSDYVKCFKALYPYVDYFTVNVSSPNTPGLRDLQDKEPLTKLLKTLVALRAEIAPQSEIRNPQLLKPILLKIAPDLTESQLDDIADLTIDSGIDGLIATNTTISRAGLKTPAAEVEAIGMGGLSGKPLTKHSTEVLQYLSNKLQGRVPIIGVGGIHSKADAKAKFDAGASLVQLYTGFIYEGPPLVKAVAEL